MEEEDEEVLLETQAFTYIENVIVQFLELPSVLRDAFAVMKLEGYQSTIAIIQERRRHGRKSLDVVVVRKIEEWRKAIYTSGCRPVM